ncbi:hypothetical protein NDU88_004163 [Pleurodeles waltl]|uniref:Uncharacterized protein n=1 Tax=Pleurodeles waltl TaxID=8319 RepID=A0AAV7SI09_PLEWA|nr:hypothetical protein NDU88_004163 [Pleurodeles waltl]
MRRNHRGASSMRALPVSFFDTFWVEHCSHGTTTPVVPGSRVTRCDSCDASSLHALPMSHSWDADEAHLLQPSRQLRVLPQMRLSIRARSFSVALLSIGHSGIPGPEELPGAPQTFSVRRTPPAQHALRFSFY